MNGLTHVALALALWNTVTFTLYGVDKRKARKNRWRISETVLDSLCLLDGRCRRTIGYERVPSQDQTS